MAGWFDTDVPTSGITQLIKQASPLSAISNTMSELNKVVDTRAKEQYTKSALESLQGVTDTKSYLEARSMLDDTQMSDKGLQALTRQGNLIQMGEQAELREAQEQRAKEQFGMTQDQFANTQADRAIKQATDEAIADKLSMTPEAYEAKWGNAGGLNQLRIQQAVEAQKDADLRRRLTNAQMAQTYANISKIKADANQVKDSSMGAKVVGLMSDSEKKSFMDKGINPNTVSFGTLKKVRQGQFKDSSTKTTDRGNAMNAYIASNPNATAYDAYKATGSTTKETPREKAIESKLKNNPNMTYDEAFALTGTQKTEKKTDLEEQTDYAKTLTDKIVKKAFNGKSEDKTILDVDMSSLKKNNKGKVQAENAYIAELDKRGIKPDSTTVKNTEEAIRKASGLSNVADVFMKEGNSGNKINVFKQWWNQNFGKQLDLASGSEDKLYYEKVLSTVMNKLRSDQFGAVLPAQDINRFNESATSLFNASPDVVRGVTSMAEAQLEKIMEAKGVLGEKAFHLKYSDVVEGLAQKVSSLKYAQGISTGRTVSKNGVVYGLIFGKPMPIGKVK